ncbi:MAG TPA: universal stress protein [Actinomycetota bacterium]|nr:universal stress protein [Actinomycetota bacterium]
MKVLYATDGFDPAVNAGSVLEKIGDRDRLDVTAMSVTHTGIPAPEHAALMLDPVEARRKDTVALVDAACEKLVAAGFRAKGRVGEGHPGPEIVRAVEDDWYDLVVMGAAGRNWPGSRVLGSVSSYVLHNSPWSVMIVHEALPHEGKSSVLVGTDDSRGTAFTIHTLTQFADPNVTTVKVVSAFADRSPAFFAVPGALYVPSQPPEYSEEVRKHQLDHAQRLVDTAITELRNSGFETQSAVIEGHAAEALLKESSDGDFDLVAVGSRGLGPFRRALMGSVSDHVVRHARATLVGRRLHV